MTTSTHVRVSRETLELLNRLRSIFKRPHGDLILVALHECYREEIRG